MHLLIHNNSFRKLYHIQTYSEMLGLCEHCIFHNGQNYQNTKFVKILCENCFHGARKLYFNFRLIGSISKLKLGSQPILGIFSFMFE